MAVTVEINVLAVPRLASARESILNVMIALSKSSAIVDTIWSGEQPPTGIVGPTAFEDLWDAYLEIGGDAKTLEEKFPQYAGTQNDRTITT